MSLGDVARVTKIQPRILERLEAGKLDGLPAEVFVRGFVRSFARCVGLDESEALRRYAACGLGAGSPDLTPTVRALVEAMAELAPGSATVARATPRRMQAVEVIDLAGAGGDEAQGEAQLEAGAGNALSVAGSAAAVEMGLLPRTGTLVELDPAAASLAEEMTDHDGAVAPAAGSSASLARKAADGVASEPPPAASATEPPPAIAAMSPGSSNPSKKKRGRRRKGQAPAGEVRAGGAPREPLAVGTPPTASPVVAESAGEPGTPWVPRMPTIATAPSVPWRRPAHAVPAVPVPAALVVPSLVIDDADPESAERVLEERAESLAPRRSFLPPILLDREDRSARQGGLTLAVILLLIAATLTLSYLMRRPGASGDGMTLLDAPAHLIEHGPDAGRGPASLG